MSRYLSKEISKSCNLAKNPLATANAIKVVVPNVNRTDGVDDMNVLNSSFLFTQ